MRLRAAALILLGAYSPSLVLDVLSVQVPITVAEFTRQMTELAKHRDFWCRRGCHFSGRGSPSAEMTQPDSDRSVTRADPSWTVEQPPNEIKTLHRDQRLTRFRKHKSLVTTSVYAGRKLAERVGFESTRKRNFRELCGMMSILKHSKKSLGLVIAP